jgi:hypothetical protein
MLDELQTKVDLKFVDTHTLIEEMSCRYDVSCFIAQKSLSEESTGITYAVAGDALRRMGLITWARLTTFQEFES